MLFLVSIDYARRLLVLARERERERERVYQIEVVTLSYLSGAVTTTNSLSLKCKKKTFVQRNRDTEESFSNINECLLKATLSALFF